MKYTITSILLSILSIIIVNAQYDITGDFKISGKLGLGTQSPLTKIHAYSSDNSANYPSITSRGDFLQFFEVINNSFEIGLAGALNTRRAWILSRHSDISGNYGQYYSTLHLQPNIGVKTYFKGVAIGFEPNLQLSNGVHLSVDGRTGIGLFNPSADLHVTANKVDSNNDIITAIIGNGYNHWTLFGGTTGGRIRGSNEGYLVMESNPNGSGDKKLYLNSGSSGTVSIAYGGGKVGIGTHSPSEKLQIKNGEIAVASGQHTNYSVHKGIKFWTDNSSYYSAIRANRDVYSGRTGLSFFTSNGATPTEVIRVNYNGHVGIGTTNPGGYKLAVEGDIGAREVNVTLDSWSDFVLTNEYKIMSLVDLESFIKEKNHLPEIPSEIEVLESGISLGEMNKLLLQKIEELTLYIINLNKEINLLKTKINKDQ